VGEKNQSNAKAINEHIKQKDIFSFHKGSSLIN
jgi:hypothetical protein